ncbi:MAG: EAL domain-containing protein [Pseudomonadaceae bacterium]|nr:EAL domain-containing protein [Pseudomonadaceae bacterium]
MTTTTAMNTAGTIRMLFAGGSESAASQWESRLRDSGIATRLTWTETIGEARELLQADGADFLLCDSNTDSSLDTDVRDIRASRPDLPIVLLKHDVTERAAAAALSIGANDIVSDDDDEHLSLVVQREFANMCLSRRLRRARVALKEAEDRCAMLLASSRAAIAYVHEGMHIFANAAYLDLFGFASEDDTAGLPLVDLLDAASVTTLKETLKSLRNNREDASFDFSGKRVDGEAVTGNMTLGRAQYEGEACLQVTVRPDDVAANLEATVAAAPQSSLGDFLAEIDADANEAVKRYLFIAEINGFDELQAQLGLRLSSEYTDDFWPVVRERFSASQLIAPHRCILVLTTDPTNDQAGEQAEMLRELVEQHIIEVNEKSIRSTVSLSGQVIETSAEAALNQAYQQLLHGNHGGDCNQVALPGSEVEAEAQPVSSEAEAILDKINQAIDDQSFMLLYQPIISLRGDSDEHYEVFLRMVDDGDEITPGDFLQTAIDNDVAAKIDRWVILQSIKMLSVHRAKGHNTRLTINITSNSVRDPEFAQWLSVAIKAARLPSDAVIFQVTENDAATYLRQTRAFIEALQAMHCRSSLGRFGVRDDAFETLRHIPVDMVKVDGTFVEDLESEDQRNQLTATIGKLQQAGKLTIVPMVESATILSALWQAGANFIQGHYLQEPTTEMDYDFAGDE